MSKKKTSIRDFSNKEGQLVRLDVSQFPPLPPPYDKLDEEYSIKPLSEEAQKKFECDLDGVIAIKFPRPETDEEKKVLIGQFLSGLKKLFEKENN
jgi:hypothetical protein